MNTTFGLAPRGYAITSHRLLELLSVNAIPVILQVRLCDARCVLFNKRASLATLVCMFLNQSSFHPSNHHTQIPVLSLYHVQDGSLLPFQEWLDWTQFALLVPEHSTAAIPAMLQAMSPATILRMQRRGKEVYDSYIKDEETLAWTLVETLKARVRALKARGGGERHEVVVGAAGEVDGL